MTWRPTPDAQLIMARRLVDERWIECLMQELRPGDIFRAVSPDGDLIDPATGEPDENMVALVTGHPIKNYNNQIGSLMGEQGYGVPIDVFASMDELKRKGLS